MCPLRRTPNVRSAGLALVLDAEAMQLVEPVGDGLAVQARAFRTESGRGVGGSRFGR